MNTSKAGLNPIKFLREVKDELSKVTWPTREETIRLTGLVIVVTLIVSLFVGSLDFTFTKLTEFLIIR